MIDFVVETTSNSTSISVTWRLANSSDRPAYFWLICFDEDGRRLRSVDVEDDDGGHVIASLTPGSSYNVCVTAVTHRDSMDLTRCVVVETDRPVIADDTEDTGEFLLIVVAVPIACLLLVLILICIAVVLCYRRRRRRPRRHHQRHRNKPAADAADVTSSSSYGSSTGSDVGGGGLRHAGTIPYASFSSPLSEQVVTSMNMYDAIVPTAPLPPPEITAFSSPPATRYHARSWQHVSDPLPLQSSLSLNVYDQNFSY